MESQIDEIFSEWNDTPGCVVGVIKGGELIFSKGYGYANLEYDIRLSSDSVFRLASVSKQFTAACVAILHLRGELSLDDPLSKHFPELDYNDNIAIRHLIHHTSGIKDYLNALFVANYTKKDMDNIEEEELIKFLTKVKGVNFEPGTEYSYSNSGYFLLGQLVKRVSGKTLRQFAHDEIFTPLGMHDTSYHDDYREIVRNRASGYAKSTNPSAESHGGFEISMTNCDIVGDGAVFSTLADLARWDLNFYRKTLGGDELIKLLQTVGPYELDNFTYAYGLGISEYKGLKTVSHDGAFVGFRIYMTRFPEYNLSVIVLANLGSIQPTSLAYKVADLYLSEHYNETEKQEDIFIKPDLEYLREKCGEYFGKEKYFHCSVSIEGDSPRLTIEDMNLEMRALSQREYKITEPFELQVSFEDEKIKVEMLDWHAEGVPVTKNQKNQTLDEYTGIYTNRDISVEYEITQIDDSLVINMRGLGKPKLIAVAEDTFFARGHIFTFSRRNGNIVSCNIGSLRARDFEFIKN